MTAKERKVLEDAGMIFPSIVTNADRIRAMTDEELAEYLDGVCHDLWQMFVKDPRKMWLDWLKQKAEGGRVMDYRVGELLDLVQDLKARVEVLKTYLKDCRNELCLRCGSYKTSHLGSCDGCRWKT